MTKTAQPAAAPASVERAKAVSVVANLTYRQHVESCPRAYYGQRCITCDGLDDAASVADWALTQAREAAGEGRR